MDLPEPPGGRFLQPPSTVPQQPSTAGALPAANGALAVIATMEPWGGVASGAEPVAFSVASGAASALISDPRLLAAMRCRQPVVLAFERLEDALTVQGHIERCRRDVSQ